VVILGSPKTAGHSPKARLVVTTTEVCSLEPADEVEEELAAGLGEGEVAEFVEHNEVHSAEMVDETWSSRQISLSDRPRT
jgi:hypothetical protein